MDAYRFEEPYAHTSLWHTAWVDENNNYDPTRKADGNAIKGIEDTMELLLGENSDRAVYSRQVDHAVQAGIKGIRLRIIFRFHPDGTIDFREIDEMIQSILLRHPQVNLMLVVSVTDPGPQWRTRHPEEGIRNAAGEYRIRNYRESPEATASISGMARCSMEALSPLSISTTGSST